MGSCFSKAAVATAPATPHGAAHNNSWPINSPSCQCAQLYHNKQLSNSQANLYNSHINSTVTKVSSSEHFSYRLSEPQVCEDGRATHHILPIVPIDDDNEEHVCPSESSGYNTMSTAYASNRIKESTRNISPADSMKSYTDGKYHGIISINATIGGVPIKNTLTTKLSGMLPPPRISITIIHKLVCFYLLLMYLMRF